MAKNPTHVIFTKQDLSQGGTYPEFVAENLIIVGYNDSTDSIYVELENGTPITSGPTIFLYRTDEVGITPARNSDGQSVSNYQFCSSPATLNQFVVNNVASFPYATKVTTENSASCGALSCGLAIQNFTKTNPTAAGGDGSITVEATQLGGSSADIQYNIGDFFYGSGQSSGTFNGLSQGTYNIVARDENNCKAEVTIILGSVRIDGYNPIYKLGYKDINGNSARFEILEQNRGTDQFTDETSGATPIIYTNSEIDQYQIFSNPVRPSYVTITLPEETKFRYSDLYTQDSRRYLGIWYKDIGSGDVELWRGFLEPTVFSAPYGYLPFINIDFVDGLALLETYKYNNGNLLFSNKKAIKIIAECLSFTDLDLPIHVACNVYEDSMNSTAADDPLDQAYLDQEFLYDEDGEAKNCKQIIQEILLSFGCKILQWNGAWWIIRIEENIDSFDYRVFDSGGDYSSNGTYNPIKEIRRACITDARAVWKDGANLEILRPAKNVIITNELDVRPSLLENYNFINTTTAGTIVPLFWTPQFNEKSFFYKVIDGEEGEGNVLELTNAQVNNSSNLDSIKATQKNIQYTTGDRIKINYDFAVDKLTEIPFITAGFKLKVGSNYLTNENTWTTTEVKRDWNPRPSNGWITFDLEVDLPDTSGAIVDTTLDFELYNYCSADTTYGSIFNDTDGVSEMNAEDGLELLPGRKVTCFRKFTRVIATTPYIFRQILFYEFVYDNEGSKEENDPEIIIPDDIAVSPIFGGIGQSYFKLIESVTISQEYYPIDYQFNFNSKTFYRNIEVMVLPVGEETPDTQTINIDVNKLNADDYELDIQTSDIPSVYLSSAKYQYDNFYKLSDNTNTENWSRDGVAESNTLQQLLAKQIVRQYTTPTFKISGTLTTNNEGTHLDITPLDSLVETQDDGKIYYINGITINDKALEYEVQLVHSKASTTFAAANGFCEIPDAGGGTDDGGGNGGSYSGGFTSGFGAGFEVIFN